MNNKTLIVIGFVLILAAFTNPDKAKHVDAVKQIFMSSINDEVLTQTREGTAIEKAGTAIGYSLGMAFIDNIAESLIQPRNLLLFSLTEVTHQANSRIIGIGMFGNVWIFGEIRDAFSQHN